MTTRHDPARCEAIPPAAFGAPDEVIVTHPGLTDGHVHTLRRHVQALAAACTLLMTPAHKAQLLAKHTPPSEEA